MTNRNTEIVTFCGNFDYDNEEFYFAIFPHHLRILIVQFFVFYFFILLINTRMYIVFASYIKVYV